jgi:DNA-binding GntR family transcriptional regulator
MVFKPSLNITEQIADHLAKLIIHGQLAGGARIQELKIARQLGVSRGSVREALLILQRRHLIEIVPRKGAVVNDINGREALDLVDMLDSVEHRWFHNLVQDPQRSEILAAAAASLATMDDAAKNADVDEMVQARGDFYEALLYPANRYLSGVFECLLPTSHCLMRTLIDQGNVDLHDIARYYRALHGALETSDEERLDELLGAFRKRLMQLCAKTFGETSDRRISACQLDNIPSRASSA